MYKIYDSVNCYLYAYGKTINQLIDSWNKQAKDNFSWILENENNEEFYEKVTEKCYRIENIEDICKLVNDVEVNCLALYKGCKLVNKLISFEDVYNEI